MSEATCGVPRLVSKGLVKSRLKLQLPTHKLVSVWLPKQRMAPARVFAREMRPGTTIRDRLGLTACCGSG